MPANNLRMGWPYLIDIVILLFISCIIRAYFRCIYSASFSLCENVLILIEIKLQLENISNWSHTPHSKVDTRITRMTPFRKDSRKAM